MEDQGKRLLLAVAIAFGIMMAWNVLFPPNKPKKKSDPRPEQAQTTPGTANVPGAAPSGAGSNAPGGVGSNAPDGVGSNAPSGVGSNAPGVVPKGKEPAAEAACDERVVTLTDNETLSAAFSTCGAALKSWELLGKKFENRKLKKPINLVPPVGGHNAYLFATAFGSVIPNGVAWNIKSQSATEVVFTWSGGGYEFEKRYTVQVDDFVLQLSVGIEKKSAGEEKNALGLSMFGYQDPNASTGGGISRVKTEWKAACDQGGSVKTKGIKSLHKKGPKLRQGEMHWVGFTHSYFVAVMGPPTNKDKEPLLACNNYPLVGVPGVARSELIFPIVNMKTGDVYGRSVTAYLGPKYLDKIDQVSREYHVAIDDVIDLGWFTFIARPLLWLLAWLQSLVVNWGIAIILLTIIVKLATLYWTTKSMRSMKAMANLKPEIDKIQKKYKDDKQRQQVEIMAMYKARGVSPLAGCLPMLLQMPIWFALYRALMAAAELYQAPFIPGWIDDLTQPDPFYVMPVLLMGTMFLQAKLSPTAADSTQQKLMMYGMPLMFGGFSFFFPSGLTLYIFTNTLITSGHHLWMNHTDPHAPAKSKGATDGEDKGKGEADEDEGRLSSDGEETNRSESSPKKGGASGASKTENSGSGAGSKRPGKKRSGKKRSGKKRTTR